MEQFNTNVQKVMDFLETNGYAVSSISSHRSCYCHLQKFLQCNGGVYSPSLGNNWLEIISANATKHRRQVYKQAISKLNDVYETGNIRMSSTTKGCETYSRLIPSLRSELDTYLESCGSHFSTGYIPCIRARCARFLIFFQNEGNQRIEEITYLFVDRFHRNYKYKSVAEKSMCEAVVLEFLRYLADREIISYLPSVYLWDIKSYPSVCCFALDDLNQEQRKSLQKASNKELVCTAESFWLRCIDFMDDYKQAGYSKSMRSVCRRALSRLFLFLGMNKLAYNPEISMAWLNFLTDHGTPLWYNFRRILLLFESFRSSGELQLQSFFRDSPNPFRNSPGWCIPELIRFIFLKEYEGKESSTIRMYRSACVRFCNYLGAKNLSGFMEITADVIKDFNLTDHHMTPEGKNAYNVRIRKFLIYLGERGLLQNPMIYLALPAVHAPTKNVVIILTDSELSQVNDYNQAAGTPIELRRSAMLLLGLRMGMRESDIVNLKLADINWNNSTIHFVQTKTKVEMELPMPVDAGNALYKYLTKGRQVTDSDYVFVNTRTPHRNIYRSTCSDAINSAIPERNVSGSGFHVTRRSFATLMLKAGIGINVITDALGHQTDDTVHKYIALDSERMRMCPLSLRKAGISMKGGFIDA